MLPMFTSCLENSRRILEHTSLIGGLACANRFTSISFCDLITRSRSSSASGCKYHFSGKSGSKYFEAALAPPFS